MPSRSAWATASPMSRLPPTQVAQHPGRDCEIVGCARDLRRAGRGRDLDGTLEVLEPVGVAHVGPRRTDVVERMRLELREPELLGHGEGVATDSNRFLVCAREHAVTRDLAEHVRLPARGR